MALRIVITALAWAFGLLAALGLGVRALALELRPATTPLAWGIWTLSACGLAVAVGVAVRRWQTWLEQLGNRGLAVIALVSCLHFAVSYASRVTGGLLWALLGPAAVFVQGLSGEGLPAVLLAATLVLLPRPGTLLLSVGCVFLLNTIFSGTLGLLELVFVATSAAAHELWAAALGLTRERRCGPGTAETRRGSTMSVALALGLANATGLLVQFSIYQALLRLYFDPWYVAAVVLITGLGYGMLGGAAGALLGTRLQGTAA